MDAATAKDIVHPAGATRQVASPHRWAASRTTPSSTTDPHRTPPEPHVAERRTTKTVEPTGLATGRPLRRPGQATRAKLLAAAVPALAQKGYPASRVDDVVKAAGVSHGTC